MPISDYDNMGADGGWITMAGICHVDNLFVFISQSSEGAGSSSSFCLCKSPLARFLVALDLGVMRYMYGFWNAGCMGGYAWRGVQVTDMIDSVQVSSFMPLEV